MADEPLKARRFGLRLKSVRVQQDRDVKDVASELGVSHQSYYAYESGRAEFSYTLLPRLAQALRVPIGELLERLYGDEEPVDFHGRLAAWSPKRFELGQAARSVVETAFSLVGGSARVSFVPNWR